MRQAKGALLPPSGKKGRLRRADVYAVLRNAVLEGVLKSGERLPSTRSAATDYGVSRGMMEEVFAQLADEGIIERQVGRGTFVASELTELQRPWRTRPRNAGSPIRLSKRGLSVASNAACREPDRPAAFNAGIADTSEFPWRIWCRMQARATRELGCAALDFADPRGLSDLRSAISKYLAQFRGIRCTSTQVVIFNSSQQALNAVAILLSRGGDTIWTEDPCYLGAKAAFELAGAVPVPIAVDNDGLMVEVAIDRAPKARLVYVTPSHQYPTGVVLSLERRIKLLHWAAKHRSWILEDDYDGEFRYAGQPLASLYSLDSQSRVIYLGSLNKLMFVSLRLAYVVVPEELVELLANIRTQLDGFGPALPQMAMALFMEEGYFASHLRRMRALYGAKRRVLLDGLATLAEPGWTWSDNAAGMSLLVRHQNADYVRRVAKLSTLDLALLSRYCSKRIKGEGLFLRFGALDNESLHAGIEQLVTAAARVKS